MANRESGNLYRNSRVLVVDDDENGRFALQTLLEQEGFVVESASDGAAALRRMDENVPDLIVSDVQMPGMGGVELAEVIRDHPSYRYIPLLLITAVLNEESLTEGFAAGADDFLRKPYQREEILARIRAALRTRDLYGQIRARVDENVSLRGALTEQFSFGSIIGKSPPMQRLYELIEKVQNSDLPVLIFGETGTGKELVARALHLQSSRSAQPFIAANCAALSEQLLESELFGHTRGSFTGANRDKAGLFEAADGGTLFLDEVGEMSPIMQAKLLRVLQDGTFNPVGSTKSKSVKVRVVTATHRDLRAMVKAGTFREDLFYRLHVLVLPLPPLRERREDVALLSTFFLRRRSQLSGAGVASIQPDAMAVLERYQWPGNVRELENEIERMLLLSGDNRNLGLDGISPHIIEQVGRPQSDIERSSGAGAQESHNPPAVKSPDVRPGTVIVDDNLPLPRAIEELERQLITRAMERYRGNKSEAARELGISRSSLISKVQSYNVARGQGETDGDE